MSRPSALEDLRHLLWSGGHATSLPQMLAAGAAVCALYSAAQLAAHGIVLDEVVMPAQIIAGAVAYPPGHPHQIFYPQAFSLPNYLGAAFWKLLPDALVLSALRDFFFVLGSVLLPFACALLLTGRPVWGYFAAVLTVTEAGLRIQGLYPVWVFPNFHSQGHIGLETAALTAVLLLARCWRLGGVLLGLMPAIHVTMSLVLWPWSLWYFFFSGERPAGKDRANFVVSVCAGLAICVVLALVILSLARSAAPVSPYHVRADGPTILREFTAFSDYHRRPFPFLIFGYLVNFVAFSALGAFLWHDTSTEGNEDSAPARRHRLAGVLLLGAVAWIWVYAARFIHLCIGHFPAFLEQVMPYRFSNFSAVLLVPLTAAVLCAAMDAMPESLRAFALALVALSLGGAGILRLFEGVSFRWLYTERTASVLLCVFWSLAFAVDLIAHWSHPRRRFLSPAAAAILAGSIFVAAPGSLLAGVFLTGYFATAAILAAAARVLRPEPADGLRLKSVLQPALVVVFLLVVLASFSAARPQRDLWTRLSPADLEIRNWLDKNAASDEEVLTSLYPQAELQTKTGHPVLMEMETFYLMTYMPRLAPVVGAMARDLYGLDYADSEKLGGLASGGGVNLENAWIEIWKSRTLADWQELARKYHFRLVLSSGAAPLQLPQALRAGAWILYAIPEGNSSGAGYSRSDSIATLSSPAEGALGGKSQKKQKGRDTWSESPRSGPSVPEQRPGERR